MTSPGLDALYHLTPLLAILAAVLINVTMTNWRDRSRTGKDAVRLRAALQSELRILHAVYQENLRSLDKGGEYLLSCRQMSCLYRGNLGRIQLLEQHEVAALVEAYGFVEVIESFLSGTCKAQGQAFRVLVGEAPAGEIRQRIENGCNRVEAALEALDRPSRVARSPLLEQRSDAARFPLMAMRSG